MAELGLSWGTWELWSSVQPVGSFAVTCELQLRHVGSRSLTRDWTWPLRWGPLHHQGCPCAPSEEQSLFPTALDLLPNISPAVFQSQMFWRLIFLEQEVRSLWAREPKVGRGSSCFWERPSMIVAFLVSCPPRCGSWLYCISIPPTCLIVGPSWCLHLFKKKTNQTFLLVFRSFK